MDDHILNVSDHLPVAVHISYNYSPVDVETEVTTVVKFKQQKVRWHKLSQDVIKEKYTAASQEAFSDLLLDVEDCLSQDDVSHVDSVTDIITDTLLDISDTNLCVKSKHKKSNAKPFWSSELSKLCKMKNVAYKAWVDAGRPKIIENQIYQQHIESRKVFRKAFRRAEAIFKSEIEEEIESCSELDQRQFWYLLKKDKKSRKLGNALRVDCDTVVTDEEAVSELWKSHFEDLGKPSESKCYDDEFRDFVEEEVRKAECSLEEMDINLLAEPISESEVEEVCKNLKCGKAQDFTGLSYEHFKYAGSNVLTVLALLFNCIIRTEMLPRNFVKGITLPLFKGGKKDPLERDDYRGITIQNVLCKIYDNIVMNRSADTLKTKLGICSTQFACKKSMSSVNASLTLQESIAHNVQAGRNVYATFFDTRKAFDTVWIDGLFYLLYSKGIRGKLWRLLRKAYLGSLTAILVNGQLSAWFRLFQGVKQGAIISMLLYICFINIVISEILQSNLGCQVLDINVGCIGYADDIAILSLDSVVTQQLIYLAHCASCKWRFDFSIKKCGVLIFGNSPKPESFYLGDELLVSSDRYNHVGVNLMTKGVRCIEEIRESIGNCRRALYCVLGQSLRKTSLSPLSCSKIYWSVVVPKLLANAEVRRFSVKELTEYERFHVQMAKDIQGLPRCSPNISALASLGWRTMSVHIDFIRIMFLHRLLSLAPGSCHRALVVRRLFFILLSGVYLVSSPLATALETCMKYNLVHHVLEWLESGIIPSKDCWRKLVKAILNDWQHKQWRFEVSLFSKLETFRIIHTVSQPICWWQLAKCLPFLKKPCCSVLRLLCGSNVLAINYRVDISRASRICRLCDLNEVEDILHFVLYCPSLSSLRFVLLGQIETNLSFEGRLIWQNLSLYMRGLIILGLDFPLPAEDVFCIRYFSCIALHNMYVRRRAFEPP